MLKNQFNLNNKNILVLGGFGLIGFETVQGCCNWTNVLILDKTDKKNLIAKN